MGLHKYQNSWCCSVCTTATQRFYQPLVLHLFSFCLLSTQHMSCLSGDHLQRKKKLQPAGFEPEHVASVWDGAVSPVSSHGRVKPLGPYLYFRGHPTCCLKKLSLLLSGTAENDLIDSPSPRHYSDGSKDFWAHCHPRSTDTDELVTLLSVWSFHK